MFSAPAVMEKLRATADANAPQARMGQANTAFYESAKAWLDIQRCVGPAAIEHAYQRVRTGELDPHQGLILSL